MHTSKWDAIATTIALMMNYRVSLLDSCVYFDEEIQRHMYITLEWKGNLVSTSESIRD
jgi:hypothetical protein